ncbi:MAG: TIGR00299 family protein [Clostridiales bacterium GWB2_37_7]|nr:MAG: TIGR00299 family protein [Clostridiales bacterium GWB2_37_7]
MKILYFDCFSGISGDMTLGALLDLGVSQEHLIESLQALKLEDEYYLDIKKELKNGIMGTKVDVVLKHADEHDREHAHSHEHNHSHNHHHHHDDEAAVSHIHSHGHEHEHRSYKNIAAMIDGSALNDNVKRISKDIFTVIGEAEGKIHGKPLEEVHFHEVGAVDSIVDIVGAAICIDALKPDEIVFSKIPLSRGFVKCQHGMFPLPAPASLEILKDVPVYFTDVKFELVTPTGAGIIKALADGFDDSGDMTIEKIGYGLGKKTYEKPNALRVYLYEKKKRTNEVVEIDTNIDDMTGEQLGFVMEQLLDAGALDVYFTDIQMKKNRPGVKLTVLCSIDKQPEITKLLLTHTSTFGVRYKLLERDILDRSFVEIPLKHGSIRCKVGKLEGEIIKVIPEYEDCRRIAKEHALPISQIFNEALGIAANYDKMIDKS